MACTVCCPGTSCCCCCITANGIQPGYTACCDDYFTTTPGGTVCTQSGPCTPPSTGCTASFGTISPVSQPCNNNPAPCLKIPACTITATMASLGTCLCASAICVILTPGSINWTGSGDPCSSPTTGSCP